MIWINSLLEHFITHPVHLTVLLVLISLTKSTVFLSFVLPPTSIILLVSISAGLPIIPLWIMWIAITAGAIAGSIINFHLGRIMMKTEVLNQLTARYETLFSRIRNSLRKNSILALFTSRFVSVLLYLVPLVAGMLFLKPSKVYFIIFISAAIWAALYVSGAYLFYCYFTRSTVYEQFFAPYLH